MEPKAVGGSTTEPLTLCWNGQPLAEIREPCWSDWPWASGKLVIRDLPPKLRTVLEWFSQQAESDTLEEPPFHETLLNGWSVVAADGKVTEIAAPLVDFQAATVEWR